MKSALILFLVIFGIFCFSSITLATVSIDYSIMTNNNNYDFTALTFDYNYNKNTGISVLFDLSYNPELPAKTDSFICFFVGYKLFETSNYNLAACYGSYWYHRSTEDSENIYESVVYDGDSAIGFKGMVDFKSITVSVLLLYALNNRVECSRNNIKTGITEDVSSLYYELMCSYQITNSLAVFTRYRSINFSMQGDVVNISGLGLGVEYEF